MSESNTASVVESAVHSRCATSSDLQDLLSPESIFTGYPIHRHPPYISILRKNARPNMVTNLGVTLEDVYFVLEIYDGNYQRASALVGELRKLFDAAVWQPSSTLSSDSESLSFRGEILENDSNQQSDGTWVWCMTLRVRVLRVLES